MLFELKQSTLLIVLVALIFIENKVEANTQGGVSAADIPQELSIPALNVHEENKRNWKQLQGSWGKRSDDFEQYETDNSEDILSKRGKWAQLQGSWGKRAEEQNPWLLNNFAKMLIESPELMDSVEAQPLKRAWAKFAGSWGKRPHPHVGRSISPRSTDWSSLRGSWGKRSANWEN